MPRGTRHIETGILRLGRWGYELDVDGGGVWRLDVIRSARRLVGERVIVEGTRAGFDLGTAETARGTKYVRTYRDNTWTDNLLALPECQ